MPSANWKPEVLCAECEQPLLRQGVPLDAKSMDLSCRCGMNATINADRLRDALHAGFTPVYVERGGRLTTTSDVDPHLSELQARCLTWAFNTFPDDTVGWRALGLMEEGGELCRALLKRQGGIREIGRAHV